MAGRIARDIGSALSAGTTAGLVTMASTTHFLAGAKAWLTVAASPNRLVKIMEVVSATQLILRFEFDPTGATGTVTAGPRYGGSDVSAYALGRLDQFAQPVWNATDADAP